MARPWPAHPPSPSDTHHAIPATRRTSAEATRRDLSEPMDWAMPQVRASPEGVRGLPPISLLGLQHLHGNRYVQRIVQRSAGGPACPGNRLAIQTKLAVGQRDDPFEREADAVADAVAGPARDPAAQTLDRCAACSEELQRMATPAHPSIVRRKGADGEDCDSAATEEQAQQARAGGGGGAALEDGDATPMIARSAGAGLTPFAGLEERLERRRGGGAPLPSIARAVLERRIGHDFGDVRVHVDDEASDLTRSLGAEAFTTRNDVYFQAGRFEPESAAGRHLLAHELTHVVQQRAESKPATRLQRFTLNGFPAAEAAAMTAAIPTATAKVAACSGYRALTRSGIINHMNNNRFDYKPESKICGWTFPASWYIEIGPKAFDPNHCCALPSTIAHEASHVEFFTESEARKLEADCFGC